MTDISGNYDMAELEYLVKMLEAESNPTVENLRKALRLRMQNKTNGWGYKSDNFDSSIDLHVAAARNTAEWKIYDAVEGIDL